MSDQIMPSLAGPSPRVFIYNRSQTGGEDFVVRPSPVVVDGNHILFRNFTRYPARVNLAALGGGSVSIDPGRTEPGFIGTPSPGYYAYPVYVIVGGKEVEAQGESRPGAIIDG